MLGMSLMSKNQSIDCVNEPNIAREQSTGSEFVVLLLEIWVTASASRENYSKTTHAPCGIAILVEIGQICTAKSSIQSDDEP